MHITEGKTDCLPEETGYHSGRILALDEHFARMMERGEIEGAAYCISKNGKVIAEKGMGLAHYYDHMIPCGRIRYMESHPLPKPLRQQL